MGALPSPISHRHPSDRAFTRFQSEHFGIIKITFHPKCHALKEELLKFPNKVTANQRLELFFFFLPCPACKSLNKLTLAAWCVVAGLPKVCVSERDRE